MKLFNIPNFSKYKITKSGDIYLIKGAKCIYHNDTTDDLPQVERDDGKLVFLTTYDIASSFYGPLPGSTVSTLNGMHDVSSKSIRYDINEFKRIDEDRLQINGHEFKKIPGYSRYFISRTGVVYSTIQCSFRKLNTSKKYLIVSMIDDKGAHKDEYVHHAVYNTYIGSRIPGLVIDHKNERPWDNSADNLHQITYQENTKKAHEALSRSWRDVSFRVWSPEILEWMCDQMANKNKSASEICDMLGATAERDRSKIYGVLFSLRFHKANPDISTKYDFSNYNAALLRAESAKKYSEPVYNAMKYFVTQTGKTNREISDILKIPRQTIYNFRSKLDYQGSTTIERVDGEKDSIE